MSTTRKIKKLNKMRAKADKLKVRIALGRRKIELKSEIKALKENVHFLKFYNVKKGLEVIKSNLIQIRDGYTGLGFEPSLKSNLLTKSIITKEDYKKMNAQEIVDTPNEVAQPEAKAQNPPQRQENIFTLPNMDLPMSDFSLDLPF